MNSSTNSPSSWEWQLQRAHSNMAFFHTLKKLSNSADWKVFLSSVEILVDVRSCQEVFPCLWNLSQHWRITRLRGLLPEGRWNCSWSIYHHYWEDNGTELWQIVGHWRSFHRPAWCRWTGAQRTPCWGGLASNLSQWHLCALSSKV